MKSQIKTLAVVISVVLNVTFVAAYGIRRFTERPKSLYEEINVSAEQRGQLAAGRDRFLKSISEIEDKILASHLELIDVIAADSTREAIEAKLAEIRKGQQSMQQLVVGHLLEEKAILTPEQRSRFFAALKSRIKVQDAPRPPWFPKGARERKR